MIVDVHTHQADHGALPPAFFAGWGENVRRLAPPSLSPSQLDRLAGGFKLSPVDPLGDAHVAEMDAAGIDLSVSLVIDYGLAYPGEVPPLQALFAQHRAMADRHPGRFLVFAGVDPRRGREGVELFERSLVEYGFRGLKLYPPCGFSPSDVRLDPYYALCTEHRVPVLSHVGPSSPQLSFQHTRPYDLDEAARRFPGVNFVLAHATVVHRDDAALLAEYRPNVYIDTSGFQVAHRRGSWPETLAFFKQRGLLRKLLFGTDWPVHRSLGPLQRWVPRLDEGALLSPGEVRWLVETNPGELLRLT